MKNILVTGASGQIGTELVMNLKLQYGFNRVIATDIKRPLAEIGVDSFEIVDVTNAEDLFDTCKKYDVDTIIHLAALLSSTAEQRPVDAWQLNMNGLMNVLEIAKQLNCQVFIPSSIAAFGPSSPPDNTPQLTIQRPTTMYGVSKVAGELLADYYYLKFGVDTRGLRFPGLISCLAPPGGGTTDYAVDMYFDAVAKKRYTSYIAKGTFMDMMYMPDAVNAIIALLEADPSKLRHRNAYNVSAMSVDPEAIATDIRKHIPDFILDYDVDPVRQTIAESWPNSLNTLCAEEDWNFKSEYTLDKMTMHMLDHIGATTKLSLN